ncbi:MAG: DinB family protein, partial [Bryobacterales bacterium]|nr:DinB family protein [Bryobacterales bacterium]
MSEIIELVERFRSGGERIAALMSGIPEAQVDRAPAPGKWSIRQILCHIADTELIAGDRIRRILAEDNPTLIPFDPDAWATKLDYDRREISSTVEILRRLR